MKQKLFTLFLALLASVGTIFAESGTCGKNLTWNLTLGVLTISGTGDMYDYQVDYDEEDNPYTNAPWFYKRNNITSLIINDGVTSIGDFAFSYCQKLTSVTIPNSVTRVGYFVFDECSGITVPVYNDHVFAYMPTSYSGAYTIPDGIESIAGGAFSHCEQLTSVTIPNSVTYVGASVFVGTRITTPVYNDHVFAYLPHSYSGAYTVPDGIESIASEAFFYCQHLTSVTIPNSVTNVGDFAFDQVGITAPVYNDYVFAYMPTSYSNGTYIIPDGIESIAGGAFFYCNQFTSIILPNSVTNIGNYAFAECNRLTSITIPNRATTIGNAAFAVCRQLTSVTIPSSVVYIGDGAFDGCTGLTSVTCLAANLPELGQKWNAGVFGDLDCSQIPLYVPIESVAAYSTADQWKEFNPIVGLCNITFVNWDGTELLKLESLTEGTMPEYTGETPTRPNDAQYKYIFTGWTPEIVAANANTTYTATYEARDIHEGIEDVQSDKKQCIKEIHDGQIFILRGEKVYTLQGQEVR